MATPARYILLLLTACLLWWSCPAQAPAPGTRIQPPPLKAVLNSEATSFNQLQQDITILDFFGTWCIPCLRAIPRLSELEKEFGDRLSVVLVSNESEAVLKKFLEKRGNFPFPIIVDGDNAWNAIFQPPALPFTVVLNGKGTVLSLTEVKDLTPEKLREWIRMPGPAPADTGTVFTPSPVQPSSTVMSSNPLVRLSEQYLYAARTGDSLQPWTAALSGVNAEALAGTLATDAQKKAFWINLYNGYTQATLSANPGKYKNRNALFREKGIRIGHLRLSLDDIEHDILRRSRIKWSLGYLPNPFASRKLKELQVSEIDYRIHFALNCGAESCPPIAFYTDEKLEQQLELATRAYLQGEADWDSAANTVHVPRLMSWFRADFGGKKGIRRILTTYGILPEGARPKIRFKPYDWTLTLDKYTATATFSGTK